MTRVALLAFTLLCVLSGYSNAGQLSDRLGKTFGDLINTATDEQVFLDPDEAFVMSADVFSAQQLLFRWQIADGYYLYRDNFRFNAMDSNILLGKAIISRGKVKDDPDFGRVEVLHHTAEVRLPLRRNSQNESAIDVQLTYQGCKEDTICYPPVTKVVSLILPEIISPGVAAGIGNRPNEGTLLSAQDLITKGLKDGNLIVNIIAFLGFGLLLAFTPCIFPMIPILSGIIVGQGNSITVQRALIISMAYVLAMAFTYALLGVIAGLFHFNLQAASQNVWVIALFSGIFIFLAFSMFGFYELQIPVSWQNRLTSISDHQKSGTIKGAATMGVLSAIIVGPCIAPPLAGVLLYISQTGNAVLGGVALLSMGLGMGLPLLVIGASAGKLLPRAGAWMDSVKRFFGFVLLGVAVWFIERIVPGPVALILWALLLIVAAIFLGALDKVESGAKRQRLGKGLGLAMLIYGAILIIGAASGGDDVFKPLQTLTSSVHKSQEIPLELKTIKSITDLDDELIKAGSINKPVMLDFYADWCITCKEMERKTFIQPTVHHTLKDFVLLQADVTENNEIDKALLRRFSLFGPPAILFFGSDGKERKSSRLVGFIEAEEFVKHITEANIL